MKEKSVPESPSLFSDEKSAPSYVPNADHMGFIEAKLLLDTPPSKNYKITYSVIQPRGFADEHAHPWDHAYYIIEGRAKIRIGDEVRELERGSLAYVPPNALHSVQNLLDAPLIVLAVVGPDSEYHLR